MPRERPWDRDDDDDDRPRRRRDEEDDYDDRPRRRRRDEEDDDDDDDRPRRRRREYEDDDRPRRQTATNGLATAALILGILSIFTSCLTGIPAIICGMIALGKPVGKGMATAGIALGLLGSLIWTGIGYWGYTRWESTRDRIRDSNNMKQIGLAMHAYHDSQGRMAAPFAVDRTGKPNTGLSWRVGMLPYIEQNNLYQQFDLNEPWDGPRNNRLSSTPIRTYTTPFGGQTEASTYTPYRVFYGNGAMFNENGRPVTLVEVLDGTSNTIMVVHAVDQVRWAEPKEFLYSPNGPLPKLGHPELPGGFQVLLADGSVRFVSDKVSDRTLRSAITRAGGEIMDDDW